MKKTPSHSPQYLLVRVLCFSSLSYFVTLSAPSAPPSSVRVSVESSTAISVQWGQVEPCADRNGPITGYSVRYGEMGNGTTQNKAVSGDSSGGMAKRQCTQLKWQQRPELVLESTASLSPFRLLIVSV